VVVNERTGTVVVNGDVRVAPVAIAHGGITVRIQTTFEVSQPPPLSEGQTKVVPQTQVDANEEPARMVYLREGASVESLVKALNALGSAHAISSRFCKRSKPQAHCTPR
jgi:flagellar P-ring protein precursor FlgI